MIIGIWHPLASKDFTVDECINHVGENRDTVLLAIYFPSSIEFYSWNLLEPCNLCAFVESGEEDVETKWKNNVFMWACVSVYTVVSVYPSLYSNTLGPLQTIWISSNFSYINNSTYSNVCVCYYKGIIATSAFSSDTLQRAPSFLGPCSAFAALHCHLPVPASETCRIMFHRQIRPISLVTVAWP